ncbi:hypothetical protein TorRG33x02_026270 [Trema orientale]|uniref:Uncharacterized protein n=1 Tax=Trema orientale TaxID=63057 RepID=A0A2P5FVN1_TREOI|nr:hypothetical protein TorRG33x02_026270 [Trema orientale]
MYGSPHKELCSSQFERVFPAWSLGCHRLPLVLHCDRTRNSSSDALLLHEEQSLCQAHNQLLGILR